MRQRIVTIIFFFIIVLMTSLASVGTAYALALISTPFTDNGSDISISLPLKEINDQDKKSQNEAIYQEEIYQKIVFAFLEPAIQEVLADYYPMPLQYDRRDIKITRIERPNGGGTFHFLINLEVRQYTGPYDKIGIDLLSLETAERGRFRTLQFKHTEDFDFHQEINREPLPLDAQEGIPQWPEINDAEIYRDLTMILLSSYIDDAIQDYYGSPYATDPWSHEVQVLTQSQKDNKPVYTLKMKVIPYTGPHNSVGIDNITICIESGPKITIEKFEHLTGEEAGFSKDDSTQSRKVYQIISYLKKFLL